MVTYQLTSDFEVGLAAGVSISADSGSTGSDFQSEVSLVTGSSAPSSSGSGGVSGLGSRDISDKSSLDSGG